MLARKVYFGRIIDKDFTNQQDVMFIIFYNSVKYHSLSLRISHDGCLHGRVHMFILQQIGRLGGILRPCKGCGLFGSHSSILFSSFSGIAVEVDGFIIFDVVV